MSALARAAPGKERTCPHCRATILQSATICPACEHSLSFDSHSARRTQPRFAALRVEGTIGQSDVGEGWEYSLVVAIRNERGEEIARQVVGVGALGADEHRTFSVAVEVSQHSSAAARR